MSNTQHQNSKPTKLAFALRSKQRADQDLVLSKKKSTVGSHKDCTVVLNSDQIQPMHCMVIQGQQGTIVRNFHPDTRINGESFGDAWLNESDCISIGNVDLLNRVNVSNNQLATSNNLILGNQTPGSCQVAPHQTEAMFELIDRLTKMEGVLDHLNETNETNRNRTRRVIKSLRDKARESEHQLSKNLEEVNHLEEANATLLKELELIRREAVSKDELQQLADTIKENADRLEDLVSSKDATIAQFAEKNSVLAAELNSIRAQFEIAKSQNSASDNRHESAVESAMSQLEVEQEELRTLETQTLETQSLIDNEATSAPNESAQSFSDVDQPEAISGRAAETEFDFGENTEVNVDPNHPFAERSFEGFDSENRNQDPNESVANEFKQLDSTGLESDAFGTNAFKTGGFNTDRFNTESFNAEEFSPSETAEQTPDSTVSPETFNALADESASAPNETTSGPLDNQTDTSPESKAPAPDSAGISASPNNDDDQAAVDPFQVLSMLDNARSGFDESSAATASEQNIQSDNVEEPKNAASDFDSATDAVNEVNSGAAGSLAGNVTIKDESIVDFAAELQQRLAEKFDAAEFDTANETPSVEKESLAKHEEPTSATFEDLSETELPPTEPSLTEPSQVESRTDAEFQPGQFETENHESFDFSETESSSTDLEALQSRLAGFVGQQMNTSKSEDANSDTNAESDEKSEPSFDTSEFLNEFEGIDDQVAQEVQQEAEADVEPTETATEFQAPETTEPSSVAAEEESGEIEFNFELAESNLSGAFADFENGEDDEADAAGFEGATELEYSEELGGSDDTDTESSMQFGQGEPDETSEQFQTEATEIDATENETAESSNPYASFLSEQQTETEEETVPETESYAESETGLSTARLFAQLSNADDDEESPADQFDKSSFMNQDNNVSSQSEATSATSSDDDSNSESEDSYIHDYMQRLLGNSGSKEEEEAEAAEKKGTPSLLEQTFEEEIRERQEMLKPSEFKPKASAPERQSNLKAMRELANQTAKSALEVSSQKKKFEQQSSVVLIATGICFFLGAISAMFITQAFCFPTLFSVIFFSLTGFGVFYFYELKNPKKSSKKSEKKSKEKSSKQNAGEESSSSLVSQLKATQPQAGNSSPERKK